MRYKITLTDGSACIEVDNPSRWPDTTEIEQIEEPVIIAKILTNEEYVGGILKLVEEKRGRQKNMEYVSDTRVLITYELPLNEIVLDFYDRLKTVSRGYASLDYQLSGNMDLAHGEDGYPDRRRCGRRALDYHPQGFCAEPRARAGLEDARADSAADVRGGDPGRRSARR